MNPYKKLMSLFPKPKTLYGQITIIAGNMVTIDLVGTGFLKIGANTLGFAAYQWVWITENNGLYTLSPAPEMSAFIVEV